ncbi:MAG: glycosyltransferase family 39 protein, partial [Saprospiraceae bacterium]|nr:glycosyltransferase family 39 protein [Saprospiraceae bacterium]
MVNRTLLFLAFALTALCVYFHRETFTAFPAHIHAWTQSDRYALALRFAEKPNLLLPRTFNLATKDGVTAVDLPLHDWLAGILMRISGTGEPWVFRVWTLLLSVMGTFFLYKLAKRQTQSAWRGVLVALWTFTLPIAVYYQDGFLPSAAGFSLLLIAYERYFSYKEAQKPAQLVQAVLFFTLAALPRSPMVMFLVCVALQEILYWRFKREHLAFIPAFGLFGAWALYKNHLSAEFGSQFLTQFTPAVSWSEFWILTQSVCKRWLLQL